jgi:RNA polymerase sigma-70 factor (ECF subfamily)
MDVTLELHRQASSIEDVYREHHARLWRSLLSYTGDASIADDAVAEAFAQAIRRGDALREPGRWVWRAAYRIAAGSLKERRRFVGSQVEASYDLDGVPADLAEALARLSDGQRAAVILHYYADLPIRDVARITGSTTAAVKVSLMRARRRLRTLLESPDD